MLLVHCVIHRENLVYKNSTAVLIDLLRSVMKCISLQSSVNYPKKAVKDTTESMLSKRMQNVRVSSSNFCENENCDHV